MPTDNFINQETMDAPIFSDPLTTQPTNVQQQLAAALQNPAQQRTALAGNTGSKGRVYLSNVQSIPNTPTKVQWDTKSYDPGNDFDVVTNNRFTAPIAGYYVVLGQVSLVSIANATAAGVSLRKNGTEISYNEIWNGKGVNQTTKVTLTDLVSLVTGDYLEIYAYNDGGGSGNVELGATASFFTVHFFSLP